MSLDDIFDDELESNRPSGSAPSRARRAIEDSDSEPEVDPRPAKRPRSSLFLPDSDDEDAPNKKSPTKPRSPHTPARNAPDIDIDALFGDLDDPALDLAPSLDISALAQKARKEREKELQLTPHAILPSSSPPRDTGDGKETNKDKGKDGEKKEKRKIARLDEGRLLGPDGFPALIKQTKGWKPKGKGHELSDLNSLMQVYQFWSHKMYPKTHFRDTVKTVEKLCHSKRMHVAQSVWRDEAKGLINGRKPEEETIDIDISDGDDDDDNERRTLPRASSAGLPPSSPSASEGPSGASTATLLEDDDFDIDAAIAEEEAKTAAAAAKRVAPQQTMDDDMDDAMWEEIMMTAPDAFGETSAPKAASRSGGGQQAQGDDDDEMWDIMREMEMEDEAKAQAQKKVASDMPASNTNAQGAQKAAAPAPTAEPWDDDDDIYMDP